MNRKIFCLALCALLFALGVSAQAQQPAKVPRIGYLTNESLSALSARTEAFRKALRELGYLEGKNIVIEWRDAEGKLDRQNELAVELVRLRVDVIVTAGGLATRSAKEATMTIPIVMTQERDPVSCAGAKRKTIGASERDHSQALPRGRPSEFDPILPHTNTNIKRDRSRCGSARREASILRCPKSQGY